jgi:hypothetical protein
LVAKSAEMAGNTPVIMFPLVVLSSGFLRTKRAHNGICRRNLSRIQSLEGIRPQHLPMQKLDLRAFR